MKFEGPTPETETRQVSVSIAAFIVMAAFALFGVDRIIQKRLANACGAALVFNVLFVWFSQIYSLHD